MGIRDIVDKKPTSRTELSDYIMANYKDVRKAVMDNPEYKSALEKAISSSFDKYSGHIGGISSKISGAGHGIGYAADAWFLSTGDIVGALGGKFLNLLGQIPEKLYGLYYGVKTGNYLDSLQNILEGAVSYLPGLTFVDQGLKRIVQKRMVKDAVKQFEQDIGVYKPWHQRLKDKIQGFYKTDVKDRSANVFTPSYNPAMS